MRRALGLGGGGPAMPPQQRPEQARQRHRFVQDGAVPVVMLNSRGEAETAGLRERITKLESALDAERTAHAGTKRLLQEAQAAHQAVQTRLAHAELAHREALDAERRGRLEAEQALAAQPRLAEPAAEPVAERQPAPQSLKPPRTKRTKATPQAEPKPVKWWTPSFRAKARKPK